MSSRRVFPELMALSSVSAMPLTKPVGISYALRGTLTIKTMLDKAHVLYKDGIYRWKDTQEMLNLGLEEMPRYLSLEDDLANAELIWKAVIAKWRLAGEPDPETYDG